MGLVYTSLHVTARIRNSVKFAGTWPWWWHELLEERWCDVARGALPSLRGLAQDPVQLNASRRVRFRGLPIRFGCDFECEEAG